MRKERLTFEGYFCDIAMCLNTRGGSFCEDGYCSQRRVWERLKEYEDAEEKGLLQFTEGEANNGKEKEKPAVSNAQAGKQ